MFGGHFKPGETENVSGFSWNNTRFCFALLLVQVINGYFRTPQKIILYFNKKYNTGLEVKPKDDSPLYSNALLGCLVLVQQMQILTLILQLENLENLVYNASALSIGRRSALLLNTTEAHGGSMKSLCDLIQEANCLVDISMNVLALCASSASTGKTLRFCL